MSIEIYNELDPVFEILGLLTIAHGGDWKTETIKAMDDYGIDGETFYNKHLKVVEKYVETFLKYRVETPSEDFFFQNSSQELFLMVLTMAVENRKYLEENEPLDPMRLRSFIAFYITDTIEHAQLPDIKDMPQLPDEKSMLEFLDNADLKSEEKWYVLDLLRRPDYWFTQLFETVRLNMPAFEKARASVSKPLEKLLKRLARYNNSEFMQLVNTCSDNPVIYATLVFPMLQVVLYSHCYQGILNEDLEKNEAAADSIKEELIRQSKSFADKSKLDILCSLKESSKYNLELAEALNLSPSTTSHHMNILMSSGLVTVQKKDGKVYYCLQEENIEKYIHSLKKLLL